MNVCVQVRVWQETCPLRTRTWPGKQRNERQSAKHVQKLEILQMQNKYQNTTENVLQILAMPFKSDSMHKRESCCKNLQVLSIPFVSVQVSDRLCFESVFYAIFCCNRSIRSRFYNFFVSEVCGVLVVLLHKTTVFNRFTHFF